MFTLAITGFSMTVASLISGLVGLDLSEIGVSGSVDLDQFIGVELADAKGRMVSVRATSIGLFGSNYWLRRAVLGYGRNDWSTQLCTACQSGWLYSGVAE